MQCYERAVRAANIVPFLAITWHQNGYLQYADASLLNNSFVRDVDMYLCCLRLDTYHECQKLLSIKRSSVVVLGLFI